MTHSPTNGAPFDGRGEAHFLATFSGKCPKPYWLLRIERASAHLDVLGVDFIAWVRYPGGIEVRVPIQVKGNRAAINEYQRLHPEAFRARAVVLLVREEDDPHLTRERLYERLVRLRSLNVRFDAYFKHLEETPLSHKMRRWVAKIEKRTCQTVSSPANAAH